MSSAALGGVFAIGMNEVFPAAHLSAGAFALVAMGAVASGRLGTGLLTANAEMWPHYRDALVGAGHDPATGRMAGGIQGWVSTDPERDWAWVAEHLGYQVDSYRRHMVEGTDQPAPAAVDPDKLRSREPRTSIDYFFLETPERMAERVHAYTAGAPVETVWFWASIGGMSEERARDHVQLVCSKLAPLLLHVPGGQVVISEAFVDRLRDAIGKRRKNEDEQ